MWIYRIYYICFFYTLLRFTSYCDCFVFLAQGLGVTGRVFLWLLRRFILFYNAIHCFQVSRKEARKDTSYIILICFIFCIQGSEVMGGIRCLYISLFWLQVSKSYFLDIHLFNLLFVPKARKQVNDFILLCSGTTQNEHIFICLVFPSEGLSLQRHLLFPGAGRGSTQSSFPP